MAKAAVACRSTPALQALQTSGFDVISVSAQDDIIDDVESFVAAAEILKERGAYKIFVMATHGLLSADAPRLIEESSIDEVSLLSRLHSGGWHQNSQIDVLPKAHSSCLELLI